MYVNDRISPLCPINAKEKSTQNIQKTIKNNKKSRFNKNILLEKSRNSPSKGSPSQRLSKEILKEEANRTDNKANKSLINQKEISQIPTELRKISIKEPSRSIKSKNEINSRKSNNFSSFKSESPRFSNEHENNQKKERSKKFKSNLEKSGKKYDESSSTSILVSNIKGKNLTFENDCKCNVNNLTAKNKNCQDFKSKEELNINSFFKIENKLDNSTYKLINSQLNDETKPFCSEVVNESPKFADHEKNKNIDIDINFNIDKREKALYKPSSTQNLKCDLNFNEKFLNIEKVEGIDKIDKIHKIEKNSKIELPYNNNNNYYYEKRANKEEVVRLSLTSNKTFDLKEYLKNMNQNQNSHENLREEDQTIETQYEEELPKTDIPVPIPINFENEFKNSNLIKTQYDNLRDRINMENLNSPSREEKDKDIICENREKDYITFSRSSNKNSDSNTSNNISSPSYKGNESLYLKRVDKINCNQNNQARCENNIKNFLKNVILSKNKFVNKINDQLHERNSFKLKNTKQFQENLSPGFQIY